MLLSVSRKRIEILERIRVAMSVPQLWQPCRPGGLLDSGLTRIWYSHMPRVPTAQLSPAPGVGVPRLLVVFASAPRRTGSVALLGLVPGLLADVFLGGAGGVRSGALNLVGGLPCGVGGVLLQLLG